MLLTTMDTDIHKQRPKQRSPFLYMVKIKLKEYKILSKLNLHKLTILKQNKTTEKKQNYSECLSYLQSYATTTSR